MKLATIRDGDGTRAVRIDGTPCHTSGGPGVTWLRCGAAWLLHPLVVSLSAITNFLVRIFGGQMKHRGPFVTEEELRLLVTVGESVLAWLCGRAW